MASSKKKKVNVKEDEEYEIEAILDKKTTKKKVEYLVQWKGWEEEYNSWVPIANLHADDLVAKFEKKLAKDHTSEKKEKTNENEEKKQSRSKRKLSEVVEAEPKEEKKEEEEKRERGRGRRAGI